MALPTCDVVCAMHDQAGEPIPGAVFEITLNRFEVYEGFVVPAKTIATSGADGTVTVALWPNQLGSTESGYSITMRAPNGKTQRIIATIPNVSTVNLHDVSTSPPYPGKPDAQVYLEMAQGIVDDANEAAASSATSAASAGTSASASAASALAASTSAAAADGSATAAAGSATAASGSATAASGSATAAAGSATAAEGFKDDAEAAAAAAASKVSKTGDTGVGSLTFDISAVIAKEFGYELPPHDSFLTNWSALFSSPVANTPAYVGVVPNGSGASSGFYARAGGGAGVPLWGGFEVNASGLNIHSSRSSGTGDEGPINFKFRNVTKVIIDRNGVIQPYGIRGRQGTSGGTLGNAVNLYWTGTALQAWVDTTNQGVVTLTSDYRIKRDIRTMEQPALERIAALRPVLYQYADNEQFNHKAEDREREGFIAHELAEVIPSAVEGEKDAPNQIQSLRIDALVAVLVKAVQEQQQQIDDLRALVRKGV